MMVISDICEKCANKCQWYNKGIYIGRCDRYSNEEEDEKTL